MTTITITQADNDAARAERALLETWDYCTHCPVAQAFCRMFPPYIWFVSQGGARPRGSHVYWYSLGRELRRALTDFDRGEIPILGSFQIYKTSEKHLT